MMGGFHWKNDSKKAAQKRAAGKTTSYKLLMAGNRCVELSLALATFEHPANVAHQVYTITLPGL
jgi:L-rhamnose isomerase